MQSRLILLLIPFLLFQLSVHTQTKKCSFDIGNGSVAYQNSINIPTGLPGNSYTLSYEYSKFKPNKSEKKFYIQMDYSILNRPKLYTPFRAGKILFGGERLWNILTNPTGNILLKSGFGGSFCSEYCQADPSLSKFKEVFEWNTALNGVIEASFKLERFEFTDNFRLLLFNGGFFQEYQRYEYDNLSYYIKPNNVNSLKNYFSPTNRLSVGYFLDRKHQISLSYDYRYQHSFVSEIEILKEQHLLLIGYKYNY